MSGSPLAMVDPATGRITGELSTDDAGDVARKLAAARAAQPDWASRPLPERAAAIRGFADAVDRGREELAKLLTGEMGKPISQARAELAGVRARIEYFLAESPRVLEPEIVHREAGLVERITREPLGVVANVSAWNYPWYVGSNVFVAALLTGNAVLYKPSELVPRTGLAIERLLRESGLPAGIFAAVVGGVRTGSVLVESPVDAIFFTGSRATGRRIAEAAASRLVPVQLELGGKDAAYVTEDVDVPSAAAALAEGAFYNAGQSCCAVERIYVHAAIATAFEAAFVEAARALVVGDPADESTFLGPIARKAQLEILELQVEEAVAAGGRLLLGGRRLERAGWWFPPTVVADAPAESALMREESFGPVIGLATVRDDDEALVRVNDSDYGLTAAIWTNDPARGERFLARCEAGSVYRNCCDRVSPRLPWSGRRGSGLGVTLGLEGIRALTRPKAWHLRG